MSRKRKYQKTTGYWVYAHVTPDDKYYIGMSQMQPCYRWRKNSYKDNSLQPYIQKFGWENIKHIIIQDNLTKEDASKIEDALIQAAKENGNCVNQQRSGLIKVSDVNAYAKQLYAENEEFREKCKAYAKQRRATPEGKIYNRVYNFNRYHPDRVIETTTEAKQKYLSTGYIPTYIKNDDLQ